MEPENKIRDILHPRQAGLKKPSDSPKKSMPGQKPAGHKNPILAAVITLLIVFAIAFGAKIADLKNKTIASGKFIYEKAGEGASALEALDTSKAKTAFGFINQEIKKIKNELDKIGFSKILSFGEILTPLAKEIPATLTDLIAFSGRVVSLTDKADDLANNAFRMAFNKEGEKLLKTLRDLKDDLKAVIGLSGSLKSHATALKIPLPENYLELTVRLYRGEALLDSLLNMLDSERSLHIAVLFQNPSEIRPAGGFIGSYGDIALENGSITSIDVRDIYDPDGWVEEKIIPPHPLQSITDTWEARDANWFFDFPTSAEKVLSMLNKSKIYSEKNIRFSAALAINVHLVEDLLEILGEIPLPEYNLTVTKDNFLEVVQKEVESGEDKTKGEPKRILKTLTPLILEKLTNLSSEHKRALAARLTQRIKSKDILAYTEDRTLEGYLQNERLGGEIFSPEGKNSDDYLAIVHSNIAGGKTDALIKESVVLESSIDSRGKISNKLTLEREHTGKDKKEWWYRTPNKDYFQILTLEGARLLGVSGHDKKTPSAPVHKPSYLRDPDIEAIEKTSEWLPEFKVTRSNQFGKTTFANWLTTAAGENKKLILEYENPEMINVTSGTNYKFVYERQSGVRPNFSYTIFAPTGYIWQENNKPSFIYETENPESRIMLDLTLEKLK